MKSMLFFIKFAKSKIIFKMVIVKNILFQFLLFTGYLQHKVFGHNNKYSYIAFRKLYGMTNGKTNHAISSNISKHSKKYKFPEVTTGAIGDIGQKELNKIIGKIKQDGYFVFDKLVPADICDSLVQFALENPAMTVPEAKGHSYTIYDPKAPLAPMYKFKEKDLVKSKSIRDLLLDNNFLRIAQEYLDCIPLNDIVLMWWSAVHSKTPNSKAAQLFHYDMDHPKFLKFFIYLTDVTSNTGPHCYVRGSHLTKNKELRDDKRYEDDAIEKHYPKEDIMELCGPKGTLMIVDTSGFHKGKLPDTGERLIFQMEFTNSFFGQVVDKINGLSNFGDEEKTLIEKFKQTYQRFY